jgi:hypothetical protein
VVLKQEDGGQEAKGGTCRIQNYIKQRAEAAWHPGLAPFH